MSLEEPLRRGWTRRDLLSLGDAGVAASAFLICFGLGVVLSDAELRWGLWATAGLTAISYLVGRCVDPGRLPTDWNSRSFDSERMRGRHYCMSCKSCMPERCHHCSVCKMCTLGLDHHAMWMGTCIGFRNRKFFMQCISFFSLGLVLLGGAALTQALRNAGMSWAQGPVTQGITTLVCMVWLVKPVTAALSAGLAAILCIGTSVVALYSAFMNNGTQMAAHQILPLSGFLVGALFCYGKSHHMQEHWKRVFNNQSTIEWLHREEGEVSQYNISWRSNLEQVFGPILVLWWLPLPIQALAPVGTGLTFPSSNAVQALGLDEESDRRSTLLATLFELYDLNGNGTIEMSEFNSCKTFAYYLQHGPLSDEKKQELSEEFGKDFASMDKDSKGHVDLSKFIAYHEKYLAQIDPDPHSQCCILEELLDNARLTRAARGGGG